MRFIVSTQLDTETHKALQLRRSQMMGEVDVGALDFSEKTDVVRGRLAKYAKKLDESAFNNQVP